MEYCYAIIMGNNVVKFGRTTKIKERIIQHYSNATSMKVSVIGVLVSYVENSNHAERELLSIASSKMEQMHGNEYFEYESMYDVHEIMKSVFGGFMTFIVKSTDGGLLVSMVNGLEMPVKTPKPQVDDTCLRVYELIKQSPDILESVIINKLRHLDANKVKSYLSNMESDGVIIGARSMHPKNRMVSVKYSIA